MDNSVEILDTDSFLGISTVPVFLRKLLLLTVSGKCSLDLITLAHKGQAFVALKQCLACH